MASLWSEGRAFGSCPPILRPAGHAHQRTEVHTAYTSNSCGSRQVSHLSASDHSSLWLSPGYRAMPACPPRNSYQGGALHVRGDDGAVTLAPSGRPRVGQGLRPARRAAAGMPLRLSHAASLLPGVGGGKRSSLEAEVGHHTRGADLVPRGVLDVIADRSVVAVCQAGGDGAAPAAGHPKDGVARGHLDVDDLQRP